MVHNPENKDQFAKLEESYEYVAPEVDGWVGRLNNWLALKVRPLVVRAVDGVRLDRLRVIDMKMGAHSITMSSDTISASTELLLDDSNRTGSTYAQVGIKLSENQSDWSNFETNYGGELSILEAFNYIISTGVPSTDTAAEGVIKSGSEFQLNINNITTAMTSYETGDLLGIYDVSGANIEKITVDNFAASLAGATNGGIGAASGQLSLDLNDLAGAIIAPAADSIAFLDATDSSTKLESVADFVSAISGDNLTSTSGVMEVTTADATFDVAADSMVFYDNSGTILARDLWSDIMTATAGNGLSAASGVLAVNTSTGLTISGDAVLIDTTSTVTFGAATWDFSAGTLRAGTPLVGTDVTNKTYVDGLVAGLSWKDAALTSDGGDLSTATLSFSSPTLTISGLTAGASLGQLDGVEPVSGSRVVITDAANAGTGPNAAYNGIWSITGGTTTSLTMVRVTDMDAAAEFSSAAVFVQQGTTYADVGFTQVNTVTTVNTDPVSWVQVNGAANVDAGAGLTKTGNTLDVGAGTGITVNANDVAVNPATDWTAAGVGAWTGDFEFQGTIDFESTVTGSGNVSGGGTDVVLVDGTKIMPQTTGNCSLGTTSIRFSEVNAATVRGTSVISGDHEFVHPYNGGHYRVTEHPTDGLMIKNEKSGKWYRLPMVECDAPDWE